MMKKVIKGDEEEGEEDDEKKTEEGENVEEKNRRDRDLLVSTINCEHKSKAQHNVIKTFGIDKFQVEMPTDKLTNLTGDFVFKLFTGIKFDSFRKTLRDENQRIT